MDGLTVGRMVHYVAPNGQHLAAIVSKVWGEAGMVNLNVQLPGDGDNGAYDSSPVERCTSVVFSGEPKPNTWHWIEKA